MAAWFNLEHSALSHQHMFLFLRSIRINNTTPPGEKGVFDIPTIEKISNLCEKCFDPPLFRAIFLMAFFRFLHMSNIAPHSKAAFDFTRHLFRKDIIFKQPGLLCPVKAMNDLLTTRKCSPDSPLY